LAQTPDPGFLDKVSEGFRSEIVKALAPLVVTVALLLLKRTRTILLAIANAIIQPPRVDGQWDTFVSSKVVAEQPHEAAELRQLGARVWGSAKRTDGTASYKLQGSVFGDKLSLTYRDGDPHGNDVGVILLRIKTTGKLMEGLEIGCNLDNGEIEELGYKWKRRP